MYHLKGTPGTYRLITCTLLVPDSGRVNIWSIHDVALLEQRGFVRFDPQAEAETVEPAGKIADEDGATTPPAPPAPPASRAKRK